MSRKSEYPVIHADMTDREYVAARVKQARLEGGLTINQLAEKLDVHRSTVLAWERGQNTPRLDRIGEIARACEIDILFVFSSQ